MRIAVWGQQSAAGFGSFLLRHQSAIRRCQWGMIGLYAALLVIPLFLPLPTSSDFIWNDIVRFSQFLFWGVWWPFVVLGTALIGRFWCGVLCPEGALSEFAGERGAGRAIPNWLKWSGWPVVSFISTTVYGQLTSVYQYPKPAALVLGGSTLAAMVVGARYGKAKRIWCRFLCPVNGVLGLVGKIAPLHFRVDPTAWVSAETRPAVQTRVNCAPLVPIKTMQGSAACQMCGRCSGYRGAIRLAWRQPGSDIVSGSGKSATCWESCLIVPVLLGLVPAALHWSSSPLFLSLKQLIAEFCINAGWGWPMSARLPWWALTNYPAQNDVMTLVDAVALLSLLLIATVAAIATFLPAVAAISVIFRRQKVPLHHMTQALIPLAAASLFCGLLSLTVMQLRSDGIDPFFVDPLRGMVILAAGSWSLRLFHQILSAQKVSPIGCLSATAVMSVPVAAFCVAWIAAFLK